MMAYQGSDSLQSEDSSALRNFFRHGARVTRAAHSLLADVVKPGDFVVDATCGNGSDTLWLCRAVGPTGRVLAFDVQASMIIFLAHGFAA